MTEQEREELIEKMAKAAWESDGTKWDKRYNILSETYLREARAALAVAEPVIREQCAKMAESHNGCEISTREGQWCEAVNEIADAIREGGKDG